MKKHYKEANSISKNKVVTFLLKETAGPFKSHHRHYINRIAKSTNYEDHLHTISLILGGILVSEYYDSWLEGSCKTFLNHINASNNSYVLYNAFRHMPLDKIPNLKLEALEKIIKNGFIPDINCIYFLGAVMDFKAHELLAKNVLDWSKDLEPTLINIIRNISSKDVNLSITNKRILKTVLENIDLNKELPSFISPFLIESILPYTTFFKNGRCSRNVEARLKKCIEEYKKYENFNLENIKSFLLKIKINDEINDISKEKLKPQKII